ncbi:MAG: SGNH/GDSL hydrolase family protein, partial [Polyangiaceae bacterium]
SMTVMLRADDREIPYSFNASGYRAASEGPEPDPDAPSIIFAGESITEGVGVRWEEAYPAVVASDLHVQPVEAAVHGYGNDQIYWAMQKELAKLHRPIAVVTFLIPELLERDLDVTRPRLSLGADGHFVKLAPEPPMPNWWKDFPLRKIAHGLFPYHDDSPIPLARAIFTATAKEARARGAYPLFVMTNWNAPCLPPDSGNPALVQRLFAGLDVPFISVTIDPKAMELSTHHPNPSAHRVLANAIEKALIYARVAQK